MGFIYSVAMLLVITALVLTMEHLCRRRCSPAVYQHERLIALHRDNYTCRLCGRYPANVAHHIVPRRFGGSDLADNLMTVCPHCHPIAELQSIADCGEE